jgi:ABC-2 type transport system permease protein
MNVALIRRLVVKDWYLNRLPIGIVVATGAGGVALLPLKQEAAGFIGLTSAFISLILLANVLPMQTIVNERKRQHLPFVMSLPISPSEYTAAKILANVTVFFMVWATLAGTVSVMFARSASAGPIPFVVLASLAPFVAFCALVAVALIGESEVGAIVTIVVTNISYSFAWYFLIREPSMRAALTSPVPVWNSIVLTIIGSEVALIAVALGAAFYVQSRKTDFI